MPQPLCLARPPRGLHRVRPVRSRAGEGDNCAGGGLRGAGGAELLALQGADRPGHGERGHYLQPLLGQPLQALHAPPGDLCRGLGGGGRRRPPPRAQGQACHGRRRAPGVGARRAARRQPGGPLLPLLRRQPRVEPPQRLRQVQHARVRRLPRHVVPPGAARPAGAGDALDVPFLQAAACGPHAAPLQPRHVHHQPQPRARRMGPLHVLRLVRRLLPGEAAPPHRVRRRRSARGAQLVLHGVHRGGRRTQGRGGSGRRRPRRCCSRACQGHQPLPRVRRRHGEGRRLQPHGMPLRRTLVLDVRQGLL
mmetsp:Transcript_1764/g.6303  ORF Transcript_1764/g.6303 Transcript_1764/m.6303 type:complete len:307 (+) Transcript_1764:2088-3008(+)